MGAHRGKLSPAPQSPWARWSKSLLLWKSNTNGCTVDFGFSKAGEGVWQGIGILEWRDDSEVFRSGRHPCWSENSRSLEDDIHHSTKRRLRSGTRLWNTPLQASFRPKTSLPRTLSSSFDLSRITQTRAQVQAIGRNRGELGGHLVIAVSGVIGERRRRRKIPPWQTGRSGRRVGLSRGNRKKIPGWRSRLQVKRGIRRLGSTSCFQIVEGSLKRASKSP